MFLKIRIFFQNSQVSPGIRSKIINSFGLTTGIRKIETRGQEQLSTGVYFLGGLSQIKTILFKGFRTH